MSQHAQPTRPRATSGHHQERVREENEEDEQSADKQHTARRGGGFSPVDEGRGGWKASARLPLKAGMGRREHLRPATRRLAAWEATAATKEVGGSRKEWRSG